MSTLTVAPPGARDLRDALEGTLTLPHEPAWDRARAAWNLAADQRPLGVVHARTVADVRATLRHAAGHGLAVAPQGTGHNARALGRLDGALLLRTDHLRQVRVDARARTVRVGPGAVWGDVVAATPPGLAPLAGSSPTVGVVGYTLAGGLSWLARRHGLASAHLRSAELVTVDGRVRTVTAGSDPELLWALRGGGGAFGVVTALALGLVEVPALTAGAMFWPWERAREILGAWAQWTAGLPDAVTGSARILQLPDLPDVPAPLRGRGWVTVDAALLEPETAAARRLAPLRALNPALDTFGPASVAALSRMHADPEPPTPALSGHALLRGLDDGLVDGLVRAAGPGSGSPLVGVELRHLGGRLRHGDVEAGALAGLDGEYLYYAFGVPVDDAVGMAIRERLDDLDAVVAPSATGALLSSFTERRVGAAALWPPAALARLRAVKSRVDPRGTIRSSHPLAP